jgi:hypothetical protein
MPPNLVLGEDGRLRKRLRSVTPKPPNTEYGHPRCYLRHTQNCSKKISREHPISDKILQELSWGETTILVDGVPWLGPGERQKLPATGLSSNILCDRHNSAFSPLDTEALIFFKKLRQIRDGNDDPSATYLCGPALELWALKAACGTYYSKNASIQRQRQVLYHRLDEIVIADAFFKNRWHRDYGLYINLIPLPRGQEDQYKYGQP